MRMINNTEKKELHLVRIVDHGGTVVPVRLCGASEGPYLSASVDDDGPCRVKVSTGFKFDVCPGCYRRQFPVQSAWDKLLAGRPLVLMRNPGYVQ